ncbi:hypothetical protein BC831DRAFT_473603 [Entophlyctis helioformis]|nr:hypothetical protein BC831DRAFT_473603 [Entophlyctis helioformis]
MPPANGHIFTVVLLLVLLVQWLGVGVGVVDARLPKDYGEDINYGDFHKSAKHFRERLQNAGYGTALDGEHDEDLFYFFSLHDYNNDGHLDGHELRLAFQGYEWNQGIETVDTTVDQADLETMIDHALAEDDVNNDGMISWAEYLESAAYHRRLNK